jgi:hypothetical protein
VRGAAAGKVANFGTHTVLNLATLSPRRPIRISTQPPLTFAA